MPDSRTHRSAAPKDRELFAAPQIPRLREATAHLSWLFTRGYGERSSLKLVGDRFDLTARQREGVLRSACGDEALAARVARRIEPADLRGGALAIDGYNVLTTLETALGGGLVLLGRDGCARDLASMRGTWRKVEETAPALALLGAHLEPLGLAECALVLDSPVSNSRRLAAAIEALAAERGWPWSVELARDADAALLARGTAVATADHVVLDRCARWLNLAREAIAARAASAWVVDLGR